MRAGRAPRNQATTGRRRGSATATPRASASGMIPSKAFVWLSLASRHGVGLAMTELEGVVKSMSGNQKATAQRRLSRWIATSEPGEAVLAKAFG